MRLEFGIFAEAGTVESNGVFGLLRAGLTWTSANTFPAKCRQLALLIRIEFEQEECGKEYVAVSQVRSPTGDHLTPDQTTTMKPTLNARLEGSHKTSFVGLYWYDGFVFQVPGPYTFAISIGESKLGEFTIHACQEPVS